jgi:hypothetical protein
MRRRERKDFIEAIDVFALKVAGAELALVKLFSHPFQSSLLLQL